MVNQIEFKIADDSRLIAAVYEQSHAQIIYNVQILSNFNLNSQSVPASIMWRGKLFPHRTTHLKAAMSVFQSC